MELSVDLVRTRSAGVADETSISCAHGLLLGSTTVGGSPTRSRAARLSLLRSRMPLALASRFAGVRVSPLLEDVDCVADASGAEDVDPDDCSVELPGLGCDFSP